MNVSDWFTFDGREYNVTVESGLQGWRINVCEWLEDVGDFDDLFDAYVIDDSARDALTGALCDVLLCDSDLIESVVDGVFENV